MSTGRYVPPSRREGYVPSASSIPPRPEIQRDTPPHISNPGPSRGSRGGSNNRGRGRGRGGRNPATRAWDIKPAETHTRNEIFDHFTHPHSGTLNWFAYPHKHPGSERQKVEYDPSRTDETTPLPPSPPPPPPRHPLGHLISYIMLFPHAHPAWKEKKELWTHTGADVMIADWEGEKKNFGRPLPVFDGSSLPRDIHKSAGWWAIDSLEIVEPRSAELAHMLEAKEAAKGYSREGRSAWAWESSLKMQWVKLHLSPTSETSEHYETLKPPFDVTGGIDGEIEKYILQIGGLKEEIEILEGNREVRKEWIRKSKPGT